MHSHQKCWLKNYFFTTSVFLKMLHNVDMLKLRTLFEFDVLSLISSKTSDNSFEIEQINPGIMPL